jgi:Predicted membrane protein
MDSFEERISKLEQRVFELEQKLQNSNTKQMNQFQVPPTQVVAPKMNQYQAPPNQAVAPNMNRYQAPPNQAVPPNMNHNLNNQAKIKEALVGKYIIGALASLLIFVGVISFVGLVWNYLSDEMKLLLITSVAIILTAIGFWRIMIKINPISSIILGTGSGLLFISILAACMSFRFIDNNTAILLTCIWAVFFILSTRYTKVFFSSIIAYIGSYIALLLGLSLLHNDVDLFVMTLFTAVISFALIFNSHCTNKKSELITSYLLTYLSYSTILVRVIIDGGVNGQLFKYGIIQIVVFLIILALTNFLYRLMDRNPDIPWQIMIGLITTLTTGLFINYISDQYMHLHALPCYILFFMITLLQIVFNHLTLKNTEKALTIYYSIILILDSLLFNGEMTDSLIGIIIVAMILIGIEQLFKKDKYPFLLCYIALTDSIFVFLTDSVNTLAPIYAVLQIAVIIYLLYQCHSEEKHKHRNQFKVVGLFVLLFNSYAIVRDVINLMMHQNNNYSFSIAITLGYLAAVLCFAFLFNMNYFKDSVDEHKQFFKMNNGIAMTPALRNTFYIVSTIMYFFGLQGIRSSETWYHQLFFTLSTFIVAFLQSYQIIKGIEKKGKLSEVWIGIKYLILAFVLLRSYFNLDVDSVLYSVTGLILAIGSISLGFKIRFKNLRLYGLILTITMVAKFIIIDMSQENSITRVIALIFGGFICFGISVIYNKLNIKDGSTE